MEERFFTVTKSNLGKDYISFRNNTIELNKIVVEFFKSNNIETTLYGMKNYNLMTHLYIEPTKADIENFGTVLTKGNGLRAFKENSKISKSFNEFIKEKGMNVEEKPSVGRYVEMFLGGYSSRLFAIDDVVYTSIDLKNGAYKEYFVPEGFEEIKASEFFKAIEDHDEKIKGDK